MNRIDDVKLAVAGVMVERLQAYSDKHHGEPLIEEAAEMITELVNAIWDERTDYVNHLRRIRKEAGE